MDWKGGRYSFPFTYKLTGLNKLETTTDHAFCGTSIVSLDDPCLPETFSGTDNAIISFSVNGKEMYFHYANGKPGGPGFYGRRVVLD